MRAWTFWPPETLPDQLDVLWCFFPEKWQPEFPAKLPHPSLVQQTGFEEGKPMVRVSFGTSQLEGKKPPDHLIIRNVTDMNEAGLYRTTAFDLDKTRWLPWCREFFDQRSLEYSSPVVGRLSADMRHVLQISIALRKSKAAIQDAT